MRIERLSGKQYAKVLDRTESEVANVINKYFNSTIFEENASQSREAMIQEITRRIQPLIMSLAESMAYKQIQKYVADELGGYIDGKIIELMANIKQIQVRSSSRRLDIDSADDKKVVMLPEDFIVDISKDVLFVLVNGAQQDLGDNYELVMDTDRPTRIIGVNFAIEEGEEDVLEVGDVISLNALIYSDGAQSGGGGAT